MEKGLLDICLFTEPVDIGKYEFLRLKRKEVWGVLVRRDSPLAAMEKVTPEDLVKFPLLMSRREMVQNELANWFGDLFDKIEIASNYNLILNAADMVKNNVGIALCFYIENISNDLRFIPFSPGFRDRRCSGMEEKLCIFTCRYRIYTLHKKRCLPNGFVYIL